MDFIHEKLKAKTFWISKNSVYFLLLCLFAFNLSSHTFAFWPGDSWWLRSVYWLLYLVLGMAFIFGAYKLLLTQKSIRSQHMSFGLAVIISAIPFGLAISMLDLSLGRSHSFAIHNLQTTGFLQPLFFKIITEVLPKHLAFGTLLYIVHFYVNIEIQKTTDINHNKALNQEQELLYTNVNDIPFLRKLPKVSQKFPQLLQAQEHYLKVTTDSETTLILYKFGQALNELPAESGHQVHRSFWVSKDNILGWFIDANNVHIKLRHGSTAPVSRRFENIIKTNYTEIRR